MDVTAFLVIGGFGVFLLAASLIFGSHLHVGHVHFHLPGHWHIGHGWARSARRLGHRLLTAEHRRLHRRVRLRRRDRRLAAARGAQSLIPSADRRRRGVPTAWVAARLTRAAMEMHTDATPTQSDVIGSLGVVIRAIPEQRVRRSARAVRRPADEVPRTGGRVAARGHEDPRDRRAEHHQRGRGTDHIPSRLTRCQPRLSTKDGHMSPLVVAIVGAALLVLLIVWFVLSRIRVAGPNQAFIITGRKSRSTPCRRRHPRRRPVRPEGRHGRVGVRDAGRAAALHPRPVQPGDPGRDHRARSASRASAVTPTRSRS